MQISTAHCSMIDAVCEDLSDDQRPESGSICLHQKTTSGMYWYLLSKSEKYDTRKYACHLSYLNNISQIVAQAYHEIAKSKYLFQRQTREIYTHRKNTLFYYTFSYCNSIFHTRDLKLFQIGKLDDYIEFLFIRFIIMNELLVVYKMQMTQ